MQYLSFSVLILVLVLVLFSVQLADAQTSCAQGQYRVDSSTCAQCPRGTYQPIYNNNGDVNSCQKCPPATYGPNTGAIFSDACFKCQVGTYNDEWGLAQCKYCPGGTSQSQTGQTFCNGCGPGTYSYPYGASMCFSCESNSYSTLYNATACTSCPVTQYTDSSTPKTRCFYFKARMLAATAATFTSISLRWYPPTGRDNYEVKNLDYIVYAGKKGTPLALMARVQGLTASPVTYTISSGLVAGTTYTIAIEAIDSLGINSFGNATLDASTVAYSVPPAVTNLYYSDRSYRSVSLTWSTISDPSQSGGYPVTNHMIRVLDQYSYSLVQQTYTNSTSGAFVVTGLQPNYPYQINVYRTNVLGNSPMSNSLYVSTLALPSVSSSSISYSYIQPEYFALQFSTVSGFSKYYLDFTNSTNTQSLVITEGGTRAYVNVNAQSGIQLLPGTPYNIRIRCFKTNPDDGECATTNGYVITAPATPVSVSLDSATDKTLTVSWVNGPYSPSIQIRNVVTYSRIFSSDTPISTFVYGDSTILSSLQPATQYRVQVKARIEATAGALESPTYLQIDVATAPSSIDASSFMVSQVTDTSARLLWAMPDVGADAQATIFNVTVVGRYDRQVLGENNLVLTNLTPSQRHFVRVRAINQGGASPAASEAIVDTAPSAPTALKVLSRTTSSFDLSWTAPAVSGDLGTYGYNVECLPLVGGGSSSAYSTFVTATSVTIPVSKPSMRMSCRVQTKNYQNAVSTFTQSIEEASAPEAPVIAFVSSSSGIGSVQVLVTPSSNQGDAPLSSVSIFYRQAGTNLPFEEYKSQIPDDYQIGKQEAFNVTLDGLASNTTYDLYATVSNSYAASQPSSMIQATTLLPHWDPTAPSKPRNLRVESISASSFHVAWDAPASDGGSPIHSYVVTIFMSSSSVATPYRTITINSGLARDYLVVDVPAATSFSVTVAAINTKGFATSDALTVMTEAIPAPSTQSSNGAIIVEPVPSAIASQLPLASSLHDGDVPRVNSADGIARCYCQSNFTMLISILLVVLYLM